MRLLLIILLAFFTSESLAQNWMQIGDFPGGSRDDGVSFTIDGIAYCGTGRDVGFQVTGDFYAFDFSNEQWTPIASLPDSARRQYAASTSYSDVGFVFGGIDNLGNYLNDLWLYYPSLDNWSLVTVPSPFEGRSGAQCFIIDSVFYVVGGRTVNLSSTNEVWAFDLNLGQWSQKNDIPGDGIWRGFATEHNGTGIAGFGSDSTNTKRGEIYFYDPNLDQWTEMTAIQSTPVSFPAVHLVNDRIYVFGGEDQQSNYLNDFRFLDLNTLVWSNLNAFTDVPRRGMMSFVSNTDFYITTGLTATERINETWVSRNIVGIEEESTSEYKFYRVGNTLVFHGVVLKEAKLFSTDGKIFNLTSDEQSVFNLPGYLPAGVYFFLALEGEYRIQEKIIIH